MASFVRKYDFTGKVALITGSSSGIGAIIATQLSQYGARVVITGRNGQALERVAMHIYELSGGYMPLSIVGDLTEDSFPETLIQKTIDKFGCLDFLVNNAGGGSPNGNLAGDTLMAEFDDVFKLNVRSVLELMHRAVPYLTQSSGSIVNISSSASMVPLEGALLYSASKAALDMITKASALELGPKGIRVNSVNPGPVFTAYGRSFGLSAEKGREAYERLAPHLPLRRIAEPEDIANLVCFLLSDDARNITGSVILSDTGAMVASLNAKLEI